MLESLLQIDKQLFIWINSGLSNDIFDLILPWIRDKYNWIPLYALVLAWIVYKKGKRSWVFILGAVITIGIVDGLSSKIIKPVVERPRPCHNPENFETFHLRVDCGSGYSFTSSHATNHFAIASYFLSILIFMGRMWKIFWIVWACSICLAQVYVGVHYPFDVFVGGLLGASIGWVVARLCIRSDKYFFQRDRQLA